MPIGESLGPDQGNNGRKICFARDFVMTASIAQARSKRDSKESDIGMAPGMQLRKLEPINLANRPFHGELKDRIRPVYHLTIYSSGGRSMLA
jgi:hypothetical protein